MLSWCLKTRDVIEARAPKPTPHPYTTGNARRLKMSRYSSDEACFIDPIFRFESFHTPISYSFVITYLSVSVKLHITLTALDV
jgi:hypothetical protein